MMARLLFATVSLAYTRPPSSETIPLDDVIFKSGAIQQQVHVVGGTPDQAKIVWMTADFGEQKLYVRAGKKTTVHIPTQTSYCQGQHQSKKDGVNHRCHKNQYWDYKCYYCSPLIHNVLLENLKPNTTYEYGFAINAKNKTIVNNSESNSFSFKTPPAIGKPISFGIVGDLGQTRHSLHTAQRMLDVDMDTILFTGDISYADGHGERWDSYGIMMEFLFARQITSYTVGNHDVFDHTENGLAIQYRFPADHLASRSKSPNQFYYSYDAGLAHVIALNSYARSSNSSLMYKWLQRDLERVDRVKTPWIVIFAHAPWYTSNEAHVGEADHMRDSLEPLLLQYRVDFVLHGHVHAYERTKRVAYNKTHPCGVTYITVGDGGNREGTADEWLPTTWTAFRESSFGFGHLSLVDANKAVWTWYRNSDSDATPGDASEYVHTHDCRAEEIIM